MRFVTRILFATVLVLGAVVPCEAEGVGSSCQLSVNVVIRQFPASAKEERRRAIASWNRTIRLMEQVPGWAYAGRWQELPPRLYRHERLTVMPAGKAIAGPPRDWLFAYEPRLLGRKHPVTIESVTVNRGPRRITFVAENGADMTPEARQVESAVITDVLSKARPEDAFALLTAGGPRTALRFGSSKAELLAAAKALAKPPVASANSEGVRDALLEAAKWFDGHRPGDAIFVMTMGLEGATPGFFGTLRNATTLGLAQKDEASFGRVRAAVLRAHIRVFGLQLGRYYAYGTCSPPMLCGSAVDEFGSAAPRDELLRLCRASFGEFAQANTEEEGYKLTAARLAHMKSHAETMYRAASEYYILGLSSTSKNLVIGLKPKVQNQFPFSFVFYSPDIPSCSNK